MMQAIDQGAIEGAMDDASGGSGGYRRSDGSANIIQERRIVQAMDEGAIERAMDGASDGSGSNRRSD